jgi:uncharacterized protein with FMN-binding domain
MLKVPRVVVIFLAAASAASLSGCGGLQELAGRQVQDLPLSSVRDGSYVASQNNFPVTARVRVTVEAGRITDIQLRRHFHGPGHGAEAIVDRVLANQSLQVDAVSAATYSSKVILLAIRSALEKGR